MKNLLRLATIISMIVGSPVEAGENLLNPSQIGDIANNSLQRALSCTFNLKKENLPLDMKIINMVSEYIKKSKDISNSIEVRYLGPDQDHEKKYSLELLRLQNERVEKKLQKLRFAQEGFSLAARKSLSIQGKIAKLQKKCSAEAVSTSKFSCRGRVALSRDLIKKNGPLFGYKGLDDLYMAKRIKDSLFFVRNCSEVATMFNSCIKFADYVADQSVECRQREVTKEPMGDLEDSLREGLNLELRLSTPLSRAQLSLAFLDNVEEVLKSLKDELLSGQEKRARLLSVFNDSRGAESENQIVKKKPEPIKVSSVVKQTFNQKRLAPSPSSRLKDLDSYLDLVSTTEVFAIAEKGSRSEKQEKEERAILEDAKNKRSLIRSFRSAISSYDQDFFNETKIRELTTTISRVVKESEVRRVSDASGDQVVRIVSLEKNEGNFTPPY